MSCLGILCLVCKFISLFVNRDNIFWCEPTHMSTHQKYSGLIFGCNLLLKASFCFCCLEITHNFVRSFLFGESEVSEGCSNKTEVSSLQPSRSFSLFSSECAPLFAHGQSDTQQCIVPVYAVGFGSDWASVVVVPSFTTYSEDTETLQIFMHE